MPHPSSLGRLCGTAEVPMATSKLSGGAWSGRKWSKMMSKLPYHSIPQKDPGKLHGPGAFAELGALGRVAHPARHPLIHHRVQAPGLERPVVEVRTRRLKRCGDGGKNRAVNVQWTTAFGVFLFLGLGCTRHSGVKFSVVVGFARTESQAGQPPFPRAGLKQPKARPGNIASEGSKSRVVAMGRG